MATILLLLRYWRKCARKNNRLRHGSKNTGVERENAYVVNRQPTQEQQYETGMAESVEPNEDFHAFADNRQNKAFTSISTEDLVVYCNPYETI